MKVSLETKIQIDFVDYCREHYPNLLVFRIPNDAKRTKRNGYISKRMGTVAGIPDIFIPELFLWIEFKGKSELRDSQIQVISKLEKDYTVAVCYSAAEAIEIINNQLTQIDMLKITGTVVKIGEVVSGQSKAGNQWSKQDFLIETSGEYPKKIKFDVWGKSLELLTPLKVGDVVDVNANAESREWEGKWFTDLKAFGIYKSTQPSNAPAPSYPNTQQTAQASTPVAADMDAPDEDLPF